MRVANYEYQRLCPNAQNLIAILGDTDGDRICDAMSPSARFFCAVLARASAR